MKKIKVAILGDSISSGIGSLMVNYKENLQENLGKEYLIKNFAYTGTMIDYSLSIMEQIKDFAADYIIIFYGNVDAQIRPNTKGKLFKKIPQRYQKRRNVDTKTFIFKKNNKKNNGLC